jgi:molecular chaperone HscC
VALGAGIQAGLRQQSQALDDVVLTDVCPYSLGVGTHNEADRDGRQGLIFMPIIERNTIVPVSIERALVTVADNQTQVRIGIYQGESRLVKNNIFLGELVIAVPSAPAGKEQVSVRYSYDMNGILEVDVTVLSTGATHQKVIINSSKELSAQELEVARGKLAGLKFHPRDQELNRALLARAERLFAGALGQRREAISSITTVFEQALETQNPKIIERAAKEFEQQLQALEQGSPLA